MVCPGLDSKGEQQNCLALGAANLSSGRNRSTLARSSLWLGILDGAFDLWHVAFEPWAW
jgi:hypothetical protein